MNMGQFFFLFIQLSISSIGRFVRFCGFMFIPLFILYAPFGVFCLPFWALIVFSSSIHLCYDVNEVFVSIYYVVLFSFFILNLKSLFATTQLCISIALQFSLCLFSPEFPVHTFSSFLLFFSACFLGLHVLFVHGPTTNFNNPFFFIYNSFWLAGNSSPKGLLLAPLLFTYQLVLQKTASPSIPSWLSSFTTLHFWYMVKLCMGFKASFVPDDKASALELKSGDLTPTVIMFGSVVLCAHFISHLYL